MSLSLSFFFQMRHCFLKLPTMVTKRRVKSRDLTSPPTPTSLPPPFKPPTVRNNQSDERRGRGGNRRSDRKGCASPRTGTEPSPNVLPTRDKVDPENLGGQQGTTDNFSTR